MLASSRMHTKLTDCSEAMARISAQETMPGQALSRAAFMASTTSKPLAELLFAIENFSLSMLVSLATLSSKIDPSQPYKKLLINNCNSDRKKRITNSLMRGYHVSLFWVQKTAKTLLAILIAS